MIPVGFAGWASAAGFLIMLAACALSVWRLIVGPNLADRIVALDVLTYIIMGLICLLVIRTGIISYLDVAISLSLVVFLATVALSRYLQARGLSRARVQMATAEGSPLVPMDRFEDGHSIAPEPAEPAGAPEPAEPAGTSAPLEAAQHDQAREAATLAGSGDAAGSAGADPQRHGEHRLQERPRP